MRPRAGGAEQGAIESAAPQDEDQIRQITVDVSPRPTGSHRDLADVERVYKDPRVCALRRRTGILLSVECTRQTLSISAIRSAHAEKCQTLSPDVKLTWSQPAEVVSERIGDFFREFALPLSQSSCNDAAAADACGSGVGHRYSGVGVDDLRHVGRLRHRVAQVSIAALIVVLGMVWTCHRDCGQLLGLLDRKVPIDERRRDAHGDGRSGSDRDAGHHRALSRCC